jgi:hypothetical protein
MSTAMRSSRLAAVALLVCLLIPSGYLAWRFRAMPHLGASGDDQLYLVSGKSLAEGRGYRIPSVPGEPFQTKYPVLYPLLLSFIWRYAPEFPQNLPAFMMLSWLVMPVYLVVVVRFFRSLGFQPFEGWLMSGLAAVSPAVLAAGTSVGPDLACATLLLLGFLLLGDGGNSRVFAAGILAGIAYLLRSAVLPVFATVPLCLLLRRQHARALAFAAAAAPFVAGWNLWARAHTPATEDPTTVFYTSYAGDFLLHFSWHNLPGWIVSNVRSLSEYTGMSAASSTALAVPAIWGLLAVAGAILLARRVGVTHYHWFGAAYLMMLLVWPYKPLLRYLLPVLPLAVAGLGWLICRAAGMILPARSRPTTLAALAVLYCSSAVLGFSIYRADTLRYESDLTCEQAAYRWIRGNLPESAKFVAAHDGLLYLYTGRQATTYEPLKMFYLKPGEIEAWRGRLPDFARARGATYAFCDARLCAGALSEDETPAARSTLEHRYREIFRSGKAAVFELGE